MNSRPVPGLRAMTAADWPCVRDIYEAGIATGHATFETSAPRWEHWDAAHLTAHRLIAEIDDATRGPETTSSPEGTAGNLSVRPVAG